MNFVPEQQSLLRYFSALVRIGMKGKGMDNMEVYNWKKIAGAYIVSLALGLAVSAGVAVVFAALVSSQQLPEECLGYGGLLAVLLGAGSAALISGSKIRTLRIPVCVGGGTVFLLGLLLMGWLLFGRIGGGFLPTAGLCLGGGLAVGLLGRKGNGKPKYKVPKMRF